MIFLKNFFIFVLCFVLFAQSLPVVASESGFVSFKVVGIEEGEKHLYEEVGYSDGKHLYVSIDFLTSYMPYTYDEESQSFIRINHDSKSLFGRVILDATGKTATLYMNSFSKKIYSLEDVYCFGDQIFLPLDQMAALLKARILEENDNGEKILAIGCCLNSLSDAEYAFSKIMNKEYLFYGYSEILDDIFYGDETIFKSASVLSYFSSTIYGMQLKNLDIIFNSGDVEIYKNFVANCLFDNEDYLNVFVEPGSLCYRFNDVLNLTKPLKNANDTLDDFLSNVNEMIEPYKDLNMENGLLYIDTRDWGAVFNTLSTVLEWANFVMQFASMNQDNSMAIKNYVNYMNGNTSTEDTVLKALKQVLEMFGEDFVNASVGELLNCVNDEILEETTKEALKLAFKKLEVVKIAIKVINAVAKHFGFDLADNTNYSILKEYEVKSAFQDYWLSLPDNHFESETESEEYRQSAILCLLSSKHLFESANKLNEKYNENSTYYDDRIELLSTVAGMFYLAVEGKGLDDFYGVNSVIKDNTSSIKKCILEEKLPLSTEEQVLKYDYKSHVVKLDEKQNDVPTTEVVSGDYLEANEEDFDRFVEFLALYEYFFEGNFSKMSNEDFFRCFFTQLPSGYSSLYYYYFPNNNYESGRPPLEDATSGTFFEYIDNPDPKKHFAWDINYELEGATGAYYRYPADKVEWIMENIFNISPTRQDGCINPRDYYYNGYYYLARRTGFGGGYIGLFMDSYRRLPDGRYKFNLTLYDYMEEKECGTAEMVAGLKDFGVRREWVFFSYKESC